MILFNFNAMGKLCRLHLLLLALLLPGVSFAQNLFKVQGCVTDEQNEPLIGATVQTIDKSKGTITDSSGNYVLSGVPKGSTLVFSYVGYKSKEAKATWVVRNFSNRQPHRLVTPFRVSSQVSSRCSTPAFPVPTTLSSASVVSVRSTAPNLSCLSMVSSVSSAK